MLWLVTCHVYGHPDVLSGAWLLHRYGELALLTTTLVSICSIACDGQAATMTMVRLCDPSYPGCKDRYPI